MLSRLWRRFRRHRSTDALMTMPEPELDGYLMTLGVGRALYGEDVTEHGTGVVQMTQHADGSISFDSFTYTPSGHDHPPVRFPVEPPPHDGRTEASWQALVERTAERAGVPVGPDKKRGPVTSKGMGGASLWTGRDPINSAQPAAPNDSSLSGVPVEPPAIPGLREALDAHEWRDFEGGYGCRCGWNVRAAAIRGRIAPIVAWSDHREEAVRAALSGPPATPESPPHAV